MPPPGRRSALAPRFRGPSPVARGGRRRGSSPPWRPTARALDLQTSATLGAALARRSEGALQDLFEFPLQQLELGDPVPHRGQLAANQREQARTESRTWPAIQRGHQGLEIAKR